MVILAAIFYLEEQNEPSRPELIKLDISADDPEAVRAAVLKYLNEECHEGSWVESDTSFFGDGCWQFDSDSLHCFVTRDYLAL